MVNIYRMTTQAVTQVLLQKARPILRDNLQPGREYSQDDIRRICKENGLETYNCEIDPVIQALVAEGLLELVPQV